jgi:glucokinase
MRDRAALGVDVGGTKTLCILVDKRHRILAEKRFQTAPEKGLEKFIQNLLFSTGDLVKVAQRERLTLVGAGVALAGKVNEQRGTVETAPNLVSLEDGAEAPIAAVTA